MAHIVWPILTYSGVPPVIAFTNSLGTPVIVDTTTDIPYYLKGAAVTPFAGGGGGAGTVTSFAFTNGGGFTGVVSNATTTPTLSLTYTAAFQSLTTTGSGAATLVAGVLNVPTPAAGLTNPMTNPGDLIVGGASGTPTRLAIGPDGTSLTAGVVTAGVEAWTVPEPMNHTLYGGI